jgi:hypothetical protein
VLCLLLRGRCRPPTIVPKTESCAGAGAALIAVSASMNTFKLLPAPESAARSVDAETPPKSAHEVASVPGTKNIVRSLTIGLEI